jgi:hypothetical protein
MAVSLSALRTDRALLPRHIIFLLLVLISVRQSIMRPEVLGKLKKSIHLIGCRTRDIPPYSVIP